MNDTELLAHIERLPNARANFKQLVRELGSRQVPRAEIEVALRRMTLKGELIELKSGHYVSGRKSREYATGLLRVHRDGYAFLIADHPRDDIKGDLFLPSDAAAKAMHGDRVLVRIGQIGRDGRAEGEIVKILKRGHTTVVGEFTVHKRGNFVKPHDDRIQQWIEIPEGMEFPAIDTSIDRVGDRIPSRKFENAEDLRGMIVVAEILDYAEDNDNAVGRVVEILGAPDDFGVDVEVVIRKHHLPHRFPPEVLAEAAAISTTLTAADLDGREDFRDFDIVTIDGETARDFDDAVWVDRLPNGNFALQIHIADVSHYVRPGSAIDTEAQMRGTSVYFPDRAIPMLPVELSTDICSLRPNVDRLVVSALLELDHKGDVISQRFTRGVIRSRERMTYTNVHKLLEGDTDLRARYAPLTVRFEFMQELALILNRKRIRRGSIDFDMPEPLIEFGSEGEMTAVVRSARNIAHRLIEEFMLAANEAVASHIERQELGSLYRIHENPDAKRVMEFEEIAAHFGYSLGLTGAPAKRHHMMLRTRDGRKVRKDITLASETAVVTSRNYQRLIAQIEGKPEERILSYLMLRSLRQARYSEKNVGHFALAASSYTHFTSPIRRYPDLVVHRVLTGALRSDILALRDIANDTSFTERRAAEAERELVEWKKSKFMEDKVGDQFDALIVNTAKFGFFVELQSLFIEGLVPIDTLPGERFSYQEGSRQIIGDRTRRKFTIGDAVRVTLDRVDAMERRVQFSVVDTRPLKSRLKSKLKK